MKWPQSKQMLTHKERELALKKAHYNIFGLQSPDVFIDLLTDSGTGGMSDAQWDALKKGDESYAGSTSALTTKETIRDLFGIPYPLLVNQGRVAENVFGNVMQRKRGLIIVGNTPFDTTRLHIEMRGGIVVDCTEKTPIPSMQEIDNYPPFLGNIDLLKLRRALEDAQSHGNKIAYVLVTATCNSNAGQPVSLNNIRETCKLAHQWDVPVFLDLARYAENAFFIKRREEEFSNTPIKTIIREMVAPADGFLVSGKKDALGNMGGFLGLKSRNLAEKIAEQIRITVGLELVDGAGYGGMSGRDIEALNQGLLESTDEQYLEKRVGQVRGLANGLFDAEIPVLPPGGHAVFIDAGQFLSHLSWDEFPGHALALALYSEGGIRSVEVGSLMLGRDPATGENRQAPQELTRLAIPRRVYTEDDMQYVAKILARIKKKASSIAPIRIDPLKEFEPRHFAAHFLWDEFK